jgi:hypothetical protein
VSHYALFKDMLTTHMFSAEGGLCDALLADFTVPFAIKELCVLALLSLTLTGPWMKKFDVDSSSEISHIQAIEVVRQALDRVRSCLANPLSLRAPTTDFFGEAIQQDVALRAVQEMCH